MQLSRRAPQSVRGGGGDMAAEVLGICTSVVAMTAGSA